MRPMDWLWMLPASCQAPRHAPCPYTSVTTAKLSEQLLPLGVAATDSSGIIWKTKLPRSCLSNNFQSNKIYLCYQQQFVSLRGNLLARRQGGLLQTLQIRHRRRKCYAFQIQELRNKSSFNSIQLVQYLNLYFSFSRQNFFLHNLHKSCS